MTVQRRSRREVVAGGAATAAAVWVLPQIRSVAAAATASGCTPQTLDWLADVGSGALANPTSVVKGATTFSLGYSDPTGAVTTSAVDAVFTRPLAVPPLTQTYHMQLGASGAGPVEITLGFTSPVLALSFSVLDVDIGGSWRDEVEVQGRLGAGPYFDGTGTPGPNVGTITADRTFRGNVATANSSPLADVAFTFAGSVDEVRIIYRRAAAIASQGIGLGNISFCA